MNEQLPAQLEKKSDLEEAAYDARLRKGVILPKEGTLAYEALEKTCNAYSGIVAQEMVAHSPKFFEESGKTRRALHAELCIKLYGTSWQETSRDDTDAARRFAHYVAGRPSFAEDLNDGGH